MTAAAFSQDDIAALKSPLVLQEYCAATLGQGKIIGGHCFFPCPFGAHTRPKLETAERDGVGVALCRACNKGGTVFDVAAGVLGVDARADFAACVREVAEKTGRRLMGDAPGAARRPARRKVQIEYSAAMPRDLYEERITLATEYADAARAAVRRAACNPVEMERHAAALGIPASVLMAHTHMGAPAWGLLGLDTAGRLLYVYTRKDDIALNGFDVVMMKRRNLPDEVAQGAPRFLCYGRKQSLYGADAMRHAGEVFVTEGESDALAVRASLWCFQDEWLHNSPDDYQHDGMAVVAKPDAGTFREVWAAAMMGKSVTLITDADEAGQEGARKTAGVLRRYGVRRVFVWLPAGGVKDARAAFDNARPCDLLDDILINRKEMLP